MEDSFSKVSGPSAYVFVFLFGIMDSQGHRFHLPAARRDNQGVLASERSGWHSPWLEEHKVFVVISFFQFLNLRSS